MLVVDVVFGAATAETEKKKAIIQKFLRRCRRRRRDIFFSFFRRFLCKHNFGDLFNFSRRSSFLRLRSFYLSLPRAPAIVLSRIIARQSAYKIYSAWYVVYETTTSVACTKKSYITTDEFHILEALLLYILAYYLVILYFTPVFRILQLQKMLIFLRLMLYVKPNTCHAGVVFCMAVLCGFFLQFFYSRVFRKIENLPVDLALFVSMQLLQL